jgi:poly(3-hydroxybutyrate) depolymerase
LEASTQDASVSQDPLAMFIPTVHGTCPDMKTGNVVFSGQTWQLWAGTPTADQHGPLLLYWHGTGSTSGEPTFTIGQAQIDAITVEGGLVASPQATTGQGTTTNNNVWYTGDFDTADQVVACAIDQLHVNTQRIYVSGASAGGLQAVYMSYARSGYLAAAAPLSGGYLFSATQQDSSNVPAAMATHGAQGTDVVIIDFAQASAKWEADVKARGGFAIDCDTGGGHVSGPPAIGPAIWQFFKDHPFKVSPEPYSGALPPIFPSYCTIQ